MNISTQIFNQLLIMMGIAVIGFLFAKLTKANDAEQKFLSKMLLYFINPCVIFTSFNVDFNVQKLYGLIFSAILSFIITFIMIGLAELIFHKNTSRQKIQKIAIVFTNCGFIGIPLINSVFGSEGVFYLMGYLISFNVMLWIYGYFQMCGKMNPVKIITNPNVLAVILGVIVFCLPFKLPSFIAKPLTMIGSTNTAMSMILLGVLFGSLKKEWLVKLYKTGISIFTREQAYREGRKKIASILITSFVRLILCGLFSMGVVMLTVFLSSKFFPDADKNLVLLVCNIVFIASLCPAAVSVSSFACLFDKDAVFANFLVCFTHVLCIITVPLNLRIIEYVL
ncbi:AEC family transporter [Treponema sp.]|uniref:AEC family transporter n=1 Tax=Treponema sp. TaxID=166 RepID=UPI00298E44AB|nr:AEC family transporter [Treponema sp.]MCR5613649.1 AEC family transporter [Treponema sp.]